MADKHYMVSDLLRAFYWFDDGLQNYLRSQGWPPVPRTHSMVLMNVMSGINRSSDIARNLGVSRQAIHITILQMIKAGMVELQNDPEDKRSKIVVLAKSVEPMRRDARKAIDLLTEELTRRLGAKNAQALAKAFEQDWGPTLTFESSEESAAAAVPPKAKRPGRPRKAPSERRTRPSPGSRRTAAVKEAEG